jgi:hypothetical protein
MNGRQPFRMFADFTGADRRFRGDRVVSHRSRWREDNSCGAANDCPECGTPLDEVPFGDCATHAADAEPERPPELAMDERPFAPPEVWCLTCGRDAPQVERNGVCPPCAKWWADNPPERPA